MGLTQNINGFECTLLPNSVIHRQYDLGHACHACPHNVAPCMTEHGNPCTIAACAAGIGDAASYYWFSPVLYELNKE